MLRSCSQVKSYLAGNPAICLALNDTLAIGRRGGAHGHDYSHGGGTSQDAVMLDDCNFHESVSLDRFDTERTLELVPPDGEFAVMNYRCARNDLHVSSISCLIAFAVRLSLSWQHCFCLCPVNLIKKAAACVPTSKMGSRFFGTGIFKLHLRP